jgi:hypothetical protein
VIGVCVDTGRWVCVFGGGRWTIQTFSVCRVCVFWGGGNKTGLQLCCGGGQGFLVYACGRVGCGGGEGGGRRNAFIEEVAVCFGRGWRECSTHAAPAACLPQQVLPFLAE